MYQGCTVTKTSHLPIRYFLALLWAHPILHISTIRVNAVHGKKLWGQMEYKICIFFPVFSNILFLFIKQTYGYIKQHQEIRNNVLIFLFLGSVIILQMNVMFPCLSLSRAQLPFWDITRWRYDLKLCGFFTTSLASKLWHSNISNIINQLFTSAQHLLLLIIGLHVSTDHSVIFRSLICYKFH